MFWWQITKYDPLNRNEKGYYIKDEWTSCSEVGKIFDNKKFEITEYMKIEDSYIFAINEFMDFSKDDCLRVIGLEKSGIESECAELIYSPKMYSVYKSVRKNKKLKKDEVEIMARLSLRENIWCELESEKMNVHFCYDYYMFIGTKDFPPIELLEKIEEKNLFVERIPCSPLCSDEEYESIMKSMGQEV